MVGPPGRRKKLPSRTKWWIIGFPRGSVYTRSSPMTHTRATVRSHVLAFAGAASISDAVRATKTIPRIVRKI